MTEVINTCDQTVGGASGQEGMSFQVFPDAVERIPKLSRRVPSIVVEPTDGGEVESGELRWPPDDVSSDVREGPSHITDPEPVEGAEPQEPKVGGVSNSV
ncbi:protein LBH-like [Notolabrus celidotus]|uniref:protein LBH-like n=1 Tax=Notolabrus celidotus TaxID=1203425 RepID=UPI0014904C2C|nr:protein LBH-like [Notolabrus celidotus]XP_034555743.1 protein LBH-like [Notolabrus celidotus]XP_034555744.1 protein LBH-like [Notolabrus celidotus]XP_034555745.1 protein LBH-like [Notolabrus celidotus]